ncbi:MAG: MATE family efflux transporter, partial [Anaerovoracaceae bacterium]
MEHVFENGITKGKFTRFVAPSVLMFIVISMYSIVDSIFVANFVGTNAFAALNLVYPLQGLVWGLSIMLAVGSSSLVAINLGQGNTKKANQRFTLICLFALVFALVIVLLSFIFFEDLITFLGANDTLRADATIYGKILIAATPAAFLGTLFEYFIRVEGKPNFTLMLYILGGVTNLVLDFIFLVPFDMGIEGAAYGTLAGMVVVMLVGGFHFLFHSVKLKFTKPSFDIKFILHSISNGSSELVTESSIGITIFAFNLIAIRLAGEAGVAAVGIVMDTQFLLVSIHLG